VDQPQAILFTLSRVLLACDDVAAAQQALAVARAAVEAQAARIRDPELRASFLQAVPINRAIVEADAATAVD
jgi:hypothetical protein